MDFISNIISNSVAGFVEAGTRTAGGYAGDALIRAGDLIENTGRGVGMSVESAAASYGVKIAGQGAANSAKANLPKTQAPKTKAITSGKPAGMQRSYSSPASSQAKKTSIGTNKFASPASTGKPATTKKPSPGPGTTQTDTSKPKPYPSTTTYPSKMHTPKRPKPYLNTAKTDASKPNPYPGTAKADSPKPKPYLGTTSAKSNDAPKPYPGTTTIPGSGKKTAVKPKSVAPAYIPPTKVGGTYNHI
ncbi:hypothetical protein K432DRAFT_442541 [Lepidopterella palustris CBS 459.81]|uniref:Uncharacterized protein n=1 Tax=Lepidopterella palustris CBS 459.81 TaxID=1314670 RepID=A0A8E2JG78_9PEZI|nr:hypothetical protein K432DRAFT_442541 [Lepidopterella palustris CBS 459.81]